MMRQKWRRVTGTINIFVEEGRARSDASCPSHKGAPESYLVELSQCDILPVREVVPVSLSVELRALGGVWKCHAILQKHRQQ
jgi:hypothetical protein